MAEKQVTYDIEGYDLITEAILNLINQYPALDPEDSITFSMLGEEDGKTMIPMSGAVVESNKESITGHVKQICLYPFYVVCRKSGLSEQDKAKTKEWLDNLGRWLEKKKITVNDTQYQLTEYPILTDERKFLEISRQTPCYLAEPNENMSEDWVIHISARYQYEYDK